MSRKARAIMGIAVGEIMLACIWYYLTSAAVTSNSQPDAPRVIGQTMGMAMGGLLGLGVILFLMGAKADRDKAKRESGDRDPN